MAQTNPSDIVDFDVVGDMAYDFLLANVSLLESGFVESGNLTGIYNEITGTVTFPKVTAIGDLGVQTNPKSGTPVAADKFTISSDTETVFDDIVAYDIDDKTVRMLAGFPRVGDAEQFMAQQVAKLFQIRIQSKVITAAETTTLVTADSAGTASWDAIMGSTVVNWGEHAWDSDSVLIAHSKVVLDLLKGDEAKQGGVYQPNSVISSGKLMDFAGHTVMPLDAITRDGTTGKYNNLIVRRGALKYFNIIGINHGMIRKAHTTTWQLDWWMSHVAHLMADLPLGVIKYQVGASTAPAL